MKKVFFVTGCIASGKSQFMQIAQKKGFALISADEVGHRILEENAEKIAEILADSRFLKNGVVDRKALGKLVFEDSALRARLEDFMHPQIHSVIVEWIRSVSGVAFVELPLYFESKNYKNLGKSLLIYAPRTLCFKRLIQRNSLSESEANARLDAQMDIEQKRALADIVIENTGKMSEFEKKCEEFLNNLMV